MRYLVAILLTSLTLISCSGSHSKKTGDAAQSPQTVPEAPVAGVKPVVESPKETPALVSHPDFPGDTPLPMPEAGTGTNSPTTVTGTAARPSVRLQSNGFYIDDQPKLLRGGTLQWFRITESEWEDRVLKFKAAGFNTIDMYVSWKDHEAVEGQFDFTTHNITKFLDLAAKHGLYIYFRPGPYITNEIDGGGLPAWIFTKSSKKLYSETELDGTLNLRTADADYIKAVDSYWAHLIPVIRPYLHTNGGPIVLFSVENEYNWFKQFFTVDKFSTYEGGAERNPEQKYDSVTYIAKLRDIATKYGVDVPIVTCPGNAAAVQTDITPNVFPIPNYYGPDGRFPEQSAYNQLRFMHQNEVYKDSPSGTTETERNIGTLRRQMMGGFDAVFHFNIVGMAQEGRQNSITMMPPDTESPQSILDVVFNFKPESLGAAFVSPTIGYFHNVVDYYGAVGPSGTLRQKFYGFRRTNMFLDSYQSLIAEAGETKRTSATKVDGSDDRMQVLDDRLGSKDSDAKGKRVSYWLELRDKAALLGLLNQTGQDITIGRGSLKVNGEALPQFTDLTITTEAFPGDPKTAPAEIEYDFLMPIHFPLGEGFHLDYSTSEILRYHDNFLVVYGKEGAQGEMRISGDHPNLATTSGPAIEQRKDDSLTLSYTYDKEPRVFSLKTADGKMLKIMILNQDQAGRLWFLDKGSKDFIIGPSYVEDSTNGHTLQFDSGMKNVFSTKALSIFGAAVATTADGLFAYTTEVEPKPEYALPLGEGVSIEDSAEKDAAGAAFQDLGDAPVTMESRQLYDGYAWYRSTFTLTADDVKNKGGLYLDSVSDFAAIYINGKYLLTMAPLGTEIDSQSRNRNYGFAIPDGLLKVGENNLVIRIEIWGHGSFMFPRGEIDSIRIGNNIRIPLLGVKARLPSVGFDSVRGIVGETRLGKVPLKNWSIKGKLSGEDKGYAAAGFKADNWTKKSFPLALEPGSVQWYQTHFKKSDLPDPKLWTTPLALTLKGTASKATIYLMALSLADGYRMKSG